MKLLLKFSCVCLCLFWATQTLQAQLKLDIENPVVQHFMKKAMQEYIPKVTGKNEKIKDIQFLKTKRKEEFTNIKGTILFQNPNAALGNGNYRFKMQIGNNLLKPKIKCLKLQVARIWFIRFYKRVI